MKNTMKILFLISILLTGCLTAFGITPEGCECKNVKETGDEKFPASEGKECCGDQEFDPNPMDSYELSIDYENLDKILSALEGTAKKIGNCNGKLKFNVGGSINCEKFKKCCDDNLHNFIKLSGGITANIESFGCDIPIVNFWYVVQGKIGITIGGNGSLITNFTPTCDEMERDITMTIGVNVTGSAIATILHENVAEFRASLHAGASASGKFSTKTETFSGSSSFDMLYADLQVKIIFDLITWESQRLTIL